MPPTLPPRPNAALLYAASGFSTAGTSVMGINAASEGLLRAMARHAGVDCLTGLVGNEADGAHFLAAVRAANPAQPAAWCGVQALDRVAAIGALMAPGPILAPHAWQRRTAGPATRHSIVGITHTTATPRVTDGLAALPAAPMEPWDAVICTSAAVRAMVLTVIEDQEAWLRERLGGRRPPRPELPVIPLGVEAAALAPAPGLRAAWRARLGIGEADAVALYLGRLNHVTKAHPVPLYQALQWAAERWRATRAPDRAEGRLCLVLAGWFPAPEVEAAFRAAARLVCPDVPMLVLDGRNPEARASAWAVADLFVSPVDNLQETFGLAPVEAMAAGLPVVVSDWDGYRETVRDGVDGFRIPTTAPPPGLCDDLAPRFSEGGLDGYGPYLAATSQCVAVDVATMADAIARLAADPALRRRMGAAGQARARAEFDWSVIVARHQALWAALAARRTEAARLATASEANAPPPATALYPARPEPFHAFRAYPTQTLADGMTVERTGLDAGMARRLLASPLFRLGSAGLPDAADLERVLTAPCPADVAALLRLFPAERRGAAVRAVLWLAKYGFLTLERAPEAETAPVPPSGLPQLLLPGDAHRPRRRRRP